MSIYLQPPGIGSDVVWLERWSIREFADGAQYFVGYSRETRDGRVSTKIVQFDNSARTARTLSGRVYQLVGMSGWESNAEYVFNTVANVIGNGASWRDVTAELIPDCRKINCVTATREELTLDATACLLSASRSHVRALIVDGRLPARMDEDGVQWLPIVAVSAYRAQQECCGNAKGVFERH
jgi:hypothetical protein